MEVLGAFFNQLGPRIQAFAINDEMKPQIKSVIEAEFAKVGYDPAAAAAKAAATGSSSAMVINLILTLVLTRIVCMSSVSIYLISLFCC